VGTEKKLIYLTVTKKIPGHGLFAELCIKARYKVLDIEDIDGYLSHN
jgi:hypothetical protein